MNTNVQVAMAMIAAVVAVVLAATGAEIHDGTGTVIATMAAGSGWLVRDLLQAQRRRRSFCQAYRTAAMVLQRQFAEVLSESELDRFEQLRPGLADGTAKSTVPIGDIDPIPRLPDINASGDILSALTVDAVSSWRDASVDLIQAWKMMGTQELAELGKDRYDFLMAWIRKARAEYPALCDNLMAATAMEMGITAARP